MANSSSAAFEKTYGIKGVNLNNFDFVTPDEIKSKEKKQLTGKTQKIWKDVFKRFFKNKWNIFFSLIILTLIALVIIAPLVSEFTSTKAVSNSTVNDIRYLKPSWQGTHWFAKTQQMSLSDFHKFDTTDNFGSFDHKDLMSFHKIKAVNGNIFVEVTYKNAFAVPTLMGTDAAGRDVWTRLFTSARWSLGLAILVATIETIIGTVIGIYIGYHVGSKVDTISMRFIEVFKSVPGLLWMLIFALVIGTSFFSMAFVLILVGWVGPVYMARMYTMKVKDSEFIKAAQTLGMSERGILFKHVLPNIVGRLLVSFVHRIPAVIFAETTLVFLGMTVGGPDGLSIGNLIKDARGSDAIFNNPMFIASISIFLLLFSVSLQIVANGIRDAFDPKTERGR